MQNKKGIIKMKKTHILSLVIATVLSFCCSLSAFAGTLTTTEESEEFDPTVLYIVAGVLVAALAVIAAFSIIKKIKARKK